MDSGTLIEVLKEGVGSSQTDVYTWFLTIVIGFLCFIILCGVIHILAGSEILIKLWGFQFKIKERKNGKQNRK